MRLEYLVKWKGYTDKHNTWEPADNLDNAKKKVTDFHQKHPSAPQRIHALDELVF
jgi:Zn-dependent protease with chaperone function